MLSRICFDLSSRPTSLLKFIHELLGHGMDAFSRHLEMEEQSVRIPAVAKRLMFGYCGTSQRHCTRRKCKDVSVPMKPDEFFRDSEQKWIR